MKIFKVPVYKVKYGFTSGFLEYVDTIIVKKTVLGIKDVVTGFDDIDVINHAFVKNGKLDYISRNPLKAKETGYHLVVYGEDFTSENTAKPNDLDDYFDHYTESKWKNVYDDMKKLTKEEKKELKKKYYSLSELKK